MSSTITSKRTLLFAATSLHVSSEEDVWEDGCQPDTSQTKLFESINIEARSMESLRYRLAEEYCLDNNTENWLFMRGDEECNDRLIFQRTENADNCEMSENEIEAWKRGEIKGYLVDYSFSVKSFWREDRRITDEEAAQAAANQE